MTFTTDLNLGSSMALLGRKWPIWSGSKAVLGTTHVVEQLLFSMFLSILSFSFDSILGSFWTFWGPNGFLGQGGFKNSVWTLPQPQKKPVRAQKSPK